MNIPVEKAEFLALFLQAILFGIFLTLAFITVLVLLSRKENTRANKFLLLVLCLMTILATAHMVLDFVRALDAFLYQPGPNGASDFYNNLLDPWFLVKQILVLLQTVLGDGVNIWRCYIVYNQRYIFVAPPLVIMVGSIVCGCLVMVTTSNLSADATVYGVLRRWVAAYFSLTFFTNFYCTVMIAWRIYAVGRSHANFRHHFPIIIVIIESGALYTSGVIAFLCALFAGSNGQNTAIDLITPLVGIIFCLIILQIRFHRKSQSSVYRTDTRFGTPRQHWTSTSTAHRVLNERTEIPVSSYPLSPLAIGITKEVEENYPREVGVKDSESVRTI